MIPNASRKAFLAAMQQFDTDLRHSDEWTGWEHRANHKYTFSYHGRLYPVKAIIHMATGAHKQSFGGANESNRYVSDRGFTVVSLRGNRRTSA